MVAEKTKQKQPTNRRKSYTYEYETSPKKLQPEYVKEYSSKEKNVSKQVSKKSKYNYKPIVYIAAGFVMLFTICYRNSLINESYTEKENLKSQLAEVQKENEQLKVNIESSLNLNSIEKTASEQLGMKKLTNDQKNYVNLQKKDYVESSAEEIVVENNVSLIDRILNELTKIIK